MYLKDISGVILVGGKSSRFGANKAFVQVEGVPLIEHVIHVLRALFDHIVLITNTPREYAHLQLPMYQDLVKGLGPLGGIYTALQCISTEAGFFVACDMPHLNPDLISHMAGIAKDHDAVVPRVGWKLEALHALYRQSCLPAVEKLIRDRQYQIIRFFEAVSTRYVDEVEIRKFDPDLRSFFNINRPEDLEVV